MMAWWERAKVGDKVVSTFSIDVFTCSVGNIPVGGVYTISAVYVPPGEPWLSQCPVFLRFSEKWPTIGYAANLFRPIQSTETGMQMLRSLLNPTKQPIKEDA